MQSGFAVFQNFAQGFDFACREASFDAREFQKPHQVEFHQGFDTVVVFTLTVLSI